MPPPQQPESYGADPQTLRDEVSDLTATADTYLAAWNETDPAARAELAGVRARTAHWSPGLAPARPVRLLDDPAPAPIRAAADAVPAGYEPYPAPAVDRGRDLVAADRGLPADRATASALQW